MIANHRSMTPLSRTLSNMWERNKDSPDYPGLDYRAMAMYWHQVDLVLEGVESMRQAGTEVLPRYPDETQENYDFRRQNAKLTNVFADIVQNLAQRPFSTEVVLSEESDEKLKQFAEDVDGCGSNLHTYAGEMFYRGISHAIDWILVDYTDGVPENATRDQERRMGVRPYFVPYHATQVLEASTAMIAGSREFVCVRLKETHVKKDGFAEKNVERVRVLKREQLQGTAEEGASYGPPMFTLWEKKEAVAAQADDEWEIVRGPEPLTLPVIPFVPFITGRKSSKGFEIRPSLKSALELQVDLYQQESQLKNIKTLTAFPMLAGNGVQPEYDESGSPKAVPVGPHQVLYAPPSGAGTSNGSWEFIEPSAESMRFLADDIKETIKELRELGRQPLTANSGNLTVVTTSFAAEKGNSAIEAWVLNLSHSIRRAMVYAGMWLNLKDPKVEVMIDTDFDLGLGDDDSFEHVMNLRENKEISHEATISEAKRRSILKRDFDLELDLELMLKESDLEDPEEKDDLIPDDPQQQET